MNRIVVLVAKQKQGHGFTSRTSYHQSEDGARERASRLAERKLTWQNGVARWKAWTFSYTFAEVAP